MTHKKIANRGRGLLRFVVPQKKCVGAGGEHERMQDDAYGTIF